MTEMKQTIINYLNNLVVEAAKNETGDYSSLINERSILPLELENAQRKVLQGEHENYSEEILNEINSKEQCEEKRTWVVANIFTYVYQQKNVGGQPDEAQEILKSFAELLKEEIVSEAEELGKIISFADLPSEYRSKLEIGNLTTARSLARGKFRILEFIIGNNDIGEQATKFSAIDDSIVEEVDLKKWIIGEIYRIGSEAIDKENDETRVKDKNYWRVWWEGEEISVSDFISQKIENEEDRNYAQGHFDWIMGETASTIVRNKSGGSYLGTFLSGGGTTSQEGIINSGEINEEIWPYDLDRDKSSTKDEPKTEPSTDEEKVDWLKEKINGLKAALLRSKSLRTSLISTLETGGWEIYWTVLWGTEDIYVLKFIEREIENEGLRAEAKAFFGEVGGEALKEVKEILERERSPNDYETALANIREEVAIIAEKINGAAEFNEELEKDFQRLDELEYTKIRELIDQKSKAEGGEFNDSLLREIMAPARATEFLNKKKNLLLLAPEYYIKKVEAKMRELGLSDEQVNSVIHGQGIEEHLDWKADIRQRTNDFINLKTHVNEHLTSWIETLPAEGTPKSSWSKSEIAIAGVIMVVVVGTVAAGIWKWIQSCREDRKRQKKEY
jgi:hypothetical protein